MIETTKESRKKSSFTSGPTTKRGGGLKDGPLRKKNFFWSSNNEKKSIKLGGRGGRGKVLVVGPLVEELLFAASLIKQFKSAGATSGLQEVQGRQAPGDGRRQPQGNWLLDKTGSQSLMRKHDHGFYIRWLPISAFETFRFVEGIWSHRKSRKIREKKSGKNYFSPYVCNMFWATILYKYHEHEYSWIEI